MADPLVFHYKDLSNTIKLTWAQMNQNLRSIEGAVTIVQDAEHNTSQLENSTALLRNQAADAAGIANEKADTAVNASATAVEKASVAVNAATTATNKAGEASQSAIDADQSAADAAQSAGEAQASASSIDPSVDPAPNKIPISDDSGTIKQGWVRDLEFELDALRAARMREQYGDGPYPALDLQFVGATKLDPRVNFVRASADWSYNSAGEYVKYEANEPIFDYTSDGIAKGLRVWGQRTNLVTYSEPVNFTAAGTAPPLASTEVFSIGGRDVSCAAITFDESTGSGYATSRGISNLTRLVIPTGNLTFSVNVKLNRPPVGLEIIHIYFSGGNSSRTIQINSNNYKGEGFHRYSVTGERVGGQDATISFTVFSSGTFTTEQTVYATEIQVERGDSASPYIPTGESQVTVAEVNVNLPFSLESAALFNGEFSIVASGGSGVKNSSLTSLWGLTKNGAYVQGGILVDASSSHPLRVLGSYFSGLTSPTAFDYTKSFSVATSVFQKAVSLSVDGGEVVTVVVK